MFQSKINNNLFLGVKNTLTTHVYMYIDIDESKYKKNWIEMFWFLGAMEDEDDINGGQRDVLDWCYVATRVLVLFSVVYFYSSLARFALAAGLGIIFYLYNNGFFGQREQPRAEAEAVNEVRQVAGAAGDANPQQQRGGDQGQEGKLK